MQETQPDKICSRRFQLRRALRGHDRRSQEYPEYRPQAGLRASHIERYPGIGKDLKAIEALRSSGIKIQLDAGSVLGRFGLACKNRSLKLLSEGLADIIASDAHGIEHRPILMKEASELVSRSCN